MHTLADSIFEWFEAHPWRVGLIVAAWCVCAPPAVDWLIGG